MLLLFLVSSVMLFNCILHFLFSCNPYIFDSVIWSLKKLYLKHFNIVAPPEELRFHFTIVSANCKIVLF
jgi:hypothetical protein